MGNRNSGRRLNISTASPTVRAVFEHSKVPAAQLADALGRHASQLYTWANGKTEPGIMAIEELAQAAGCKIVVLPVNGNDQDLLTALGYEVEVNVRRKA